MATRSCPTCGAQYVATVRRCIDCDVVLVDEKVDDGSDSPAVSTGEPVGSGDQIGYELDGWGNQLKVTLDGMLLKGGIGRVWEAGALVVAAQDEEAVDDLIATLEGGDLPELEIAANGGVRRVALEIEGLDADGFAELDARLIAGAVAHAWDDEGALVVTEADEERVLEIIGEVLDGQDEGSDEDGLVAQQALSSLYVAVDRLIKHPHDTKLATAYVAAAEGLDGVGVPYGFARSDWDDLVAEADALAAAIGAFATRPGADIEVDDDIEDDDFVAAEDLDEDGVDGPDEAESAKADDPATAQDLDDGDGDGDEDGSSEDDDRDAARALRARLVDLV